MKVKKSIVFICTGLGHTNRGFEQYIGSLAENLSIEIPKESFSLAVWSGGNWQGKSINSKKINNISRHFFEKFFEPSSAFIWEQRTFFMGMLWAMFLGNRPSLFYLGEYRLYCYLFKFRKLFGLTYKLCLYTGANAIPGKSLFDPRLDFIHHVNMPLFRQATYLDNKRQLLLPHFVNFNFTFNDALANQIKKMAGGRKILLYVGAIQKSYKRADVLVSALPLLRETVFPVFAGRVEKDFKEFHACMLENLGMNNYWQGLLSREQLGTLYKLADLLVHPAKTEIFGLVYIEALYFGIPVLTPRHEQSEYVLGTYAHWINAETSKDLALEIDNWFLKQNVVFKDPLKRKNFAESQYGWESLANDYLKLFKNALE